MRRQGYFSVRTGRHPAGAKLGLPDLKKLFLALHEDFSSRSYFDEAFGSHCVDSGYMPGALGSDIERSLFLALRKEDLWPIHTHLESYTEDDVFDIIEFLFDHVSKPIDGYYHDYANCGMHYSSFNREEGRTEFRLALNSFLETYAAGYTLKENGELHQIPEKGMERLMAASLPRVDPANVEARVAAAVSRFQRYRSSLEDRKHALRDLADVLEYLRPRAKKVLAKQDETDIFNLANNFGIRHHNQAQKTNYDTAIWYSWLFYYYLATIHACLRLLERS
ncbi:MAG TPA: hypothetical protein VIA62_09150 [Thermoanaerobaculia bacterium]|jgi:hypothetical protein|nr:hypothetical protein [Thermoanaerobaculia bacterium]